MEIYFWRPRSILGDEISKLSRFYRKNVQPSPFGRSNFGDELGPVIVQRILDLNGVVPSPRMLRSSKPTLFTVGSVTYMARNGDVFWGSGYLGGNKPALRPGVNNIHVHALRGPLTREILSKKHGVKGMPEVYGDPAILIPRLFPELKPILSGAETLLLTHMDDPPPPPLGPHVEHLSATEGYSNVVARIAGAKRVVTSSLHGKILADAYGVPSVTYQGSTTRPLKFHDYALGSGQEIFPIATSLLSALDSAGQSPTDLTQVGTALLNAFPIHLWD